MTFSLRQPLVPDTIPELLEMLDQNLRARFGDPNAPGIQTDRRTLDLRGVILLVSFCVTSALGWLSLGRFAIDGRVTIVESIWRHGLALAQVPRFGAAMLAGVVLSALLAPECMVHHVRAVLRVFRGGLWRLDAACREPFRLAQACMVLRNRDNPRVRASGACGGGAPQPLAFARGNQAEPFGAAGCTGSDPCDAFSASRPNKAGKMMNSGLGLGIALGLSVCATAAAADCNGVPEACNLANGTYHITLPPENAGPVPAIMFLHGYGGEGLATMRNTGMVDVMLQRGYAVISPDGQPREGASGRSWGFHPDRPSKRDETAFLVAVADDAAARFGLDRDQMMLAGFSIGGSMTSYVACTAPQAFAAYAPVAGSFWRPHPESCAGPVRLLHTHGTADRTVPMVGRQISPGFVQGNVLESMEIWRATNKCPEPHQAFSLGIYSVERWNTCASGSELEFALHEGGHTIPKGWAQMAVDWFEDR